MGRKSCFKKGMFYEPFSRCIPRDGCSKTECCTLLKLHAIYLQKSETIFNIVHKYKETLKWCLGQLSHFPSMDDWTVLFMISKKYGNLTDPSFSSPPSSF
jgi:hypothetical protein